MEIKNGKIRIKKANTRSSSFIIRRGKGGAEFGNWDFPLDHQYGLGGERGIKKIQKPAVS